MQPLQLRGLHSDASYLRGSHHGVREVLMDCTMLKAELINDPLGRGYAGMSDSEAAADLNALTRTRARASMSGDEVFCVTAAAEFAGLTDAKRSLWVAFCGRDSISPASTPNVELVKWIFGTASETVTALSEARVEAISRATELGLPKVKIGHVQMAREG